MQQNTPILNVPLDEFGQIDTPVWPPLLNDKERFHQPWRFPCALFQSVAQPQPQAPAAPLPVTVD